MRRKFETEAKVILEQAEREHGINKFIACISGGKDSITAATIVAGLDKLDGVLFIDTTIGLKETQDFVTELCNKKGWKLTILKPKISYEDFVLKKFGFPSARFHGAVMGILKHHPLRKYVNEHKSDKIGLISGVRRFESKRRMRTMTNPIMKEGNMIFVAPILNMKTEQVWEYVNKYKIEVSPAYKTLHYSGDCLCGAFSHAGEAELIALFYPEIARKIKDLESRCKMKFNKWGNQSSMTGAMNQERMTKFVCSDCQLSER